MSQKAKDFLRQNANWISTVLGLLATCIIVVWNSGRQYQSLENKMSGLQAQVVEIRGIIDKRDVTINGHEARLRDVEALRYSIDQINKTISSVFEKLGATDARLSKLEDLVKINEQVKINTGRIDRLETFMLDSSKDRAGINVKLDQIQVDMKELKTMHMQK